MKLLNHCLAKFEAVRALGHDKRGVTALEYGMIAALIAVVIVAAVTAVGTGLATTFLAIAAVI